MERRCEGGFVLMKMTTLCYIENNDCYLMLHRTKKKKDVNKDKWIGVGGHAEGNETPQECLLREVKEETGLLLTSYKFRGLITFISDEYEAEMMCLFTADGYTGELITCDEGELEWVKKSDVPQLPTWEGDAQFLKLLLEDEKRFFAMKLRYEGERLVEKSVEFCGA
jgi:8-oxo-dGTP diphosphatase